MTTAILSTESDADMTQLLALANKLGIKMLEGEEAEDLAMAYAIESGKTGEYIDTQDFIKSLRQCKLLERKTIERNIY